MVVRSSIGALLLGLACAAAVRSENPNPAADSSRPPRLTYLCENIPPSNFLQGDSLMGISVELLRAIWARMGMPAQPIKVVPWARGYQEALAEPGTVLFSMTRTREREKLFKWVGPIFTVRNVLLGLADQPHPLFRLEDAKAYRIGVIKGDVLESHLLANGFDTSWIEGVSDLSQNFQKLRRHRIDLIAHSENTFRDFIRSSGMEAADFKTEFVLSEAPNYYAFHVSTPDSTIRRFQSALESLRRQHEELLAKHGLSR